MNATQGLDHVDFKIRQRGLPCSNGAIHGEALQKRTVTDISWKC